MHKMILTLLSPVTTITRMPAVMHESIAFFTSSLGGSSIPTFKRDEENIYNINKYWWRACGKEDDFKY